MRKDSKMCKYVSMVMILLLVSSGLFFLFMINVSDDLITGDTSDEYTSTVDFDSGSKNDTQTSTDLATIPAGELHLKHGVNYSDNFDSESDGTSPPANWITEDGTYLPALHEVDDDGVNRTDANAMLLKGGAQFGFCRHELSSDLVTDANITFWMYIPLISKTYYIMTRNATGHLYTDPHTESAAYISLRNTNDIKSYDGSAWVDTGTDYTAGWHRFDFKHDFVGSTYDLYYDSVLIADDFDMDGPVGMITQIKAFGVGVSSVGGTFDIHYDDMSVGTYYTSGNWTTPLITQPSSDVLNNITIDLNNSWAGNCIDKIEILNSTDAIISTDTTDLTTNATIIRDGTTFDNGFNGTYDNGSFKVKLYLKGTGTDTPIIQRFNYTTLNYSTGTPEFANITETPDPQTRTNNVNLTVNITTDVGSIDVVVVNITYPDTSYTNTSMVQGSGNESYYNITFNQEGQHVYVIWANDTNNNWNSSGNQYFNITDYPPEFTNIAETPPMQLRTANLNATVDITDDVLINGVWINITFPDTTTSNTTMTQGDGYEWYYNTTYNQKGLHTYIVWANDSLDQPNSTATQYFNITDDPPVLGWWNINWNNRTKLTFDNSDQIENLTNFPVMVKLNSTNFNYSLCNANGSDIRFIDEDDSTELTHHFEIWNISSDSYLWVNVTQIDAESQWDYIWLYYGNPSALDNQNETGTYSSDYTLAYHMDWNETGTGIDDSTINGYDGTPYNFDGGENTTGKIGNAIRFNEDGSNDEWVNITGTQTLAPGENFTATLWFNSGNTFNQWWILLGKGDGGWGNGSVMAINHDDGWIMGVRTNETGTQTFNGHFGAPLYTDNEWRMFTVTYDYLASNFSMYFDGYWIMSNPSYGKGEAVATTIKLCSFADVGADYFNGSLDEIQLLNRSKSQYWINASYLSQTNNFIIYGSVEAISIQSIPDSQLRTGYVNVTVEVNDDLDVDEVWLNVTHPDSTYTNNSMSTLPFVIDGTYWYNTTYNQEGQHSYIIWANDTYNQFSSSSIGYFNMTDGAPKLYNLTATPSSQLRTNSVNVTVNITDDIDVNSAWLNITYPDASTSNVSMNQGVGNEWYLNTTYNQKGQHYTTIWTNDTANQWNSTNGTISYPDFQSSASLDGYIFSGDTIYSRVLAGTGATLTTTTIGNVVVGKSFTGAYAIERGFLSFDTSSVTEEIIQMELFIKVFTMNKDYNFGVEVNNVNYGTSLTNADWTTSDIRNEGILLNTSSVTPGNWYSINVSIDGITNTTTQYKLNVINETTPPTGIGQIYFYSGDAVSANRPYLRITSKYSTGYYFVMIDDVPELSNFQVTPSPQVRPGNANISATITDDLGVNGAWVNVTLPDSSTQNNSMSNSGSSYWYNTTYLQVGQHSYIIWANDTLDQSNSSATNYFNITDTEPELWGALTIPSTVHPGDVLSIYCNATDNIDIPTVWLNITSPSGVTQNVSMNLSYSHVYIYNLTYSVYAEPGTYTFTIWANDTLNQFNSTTGSFELEQELYDITFLVLNLVLIVFVIFIILKIIIGLSGDGGQYYRRYWT